MADEISQVLSMLSEGKITAEEAEKLINAIRPTPEAQSFGFDPFMGFSGMGRGRAKRGGGRSSGRHRHSGPRFLRIVVDEDDNGKRERVNIKIPLKLLRAGISLGGLMPKEAKEKIAQALAAKGIDVDPFSLEGADAEEIVEALSDLEIDLDGKGKTVRVFVVHDDDDEDGPSDTDHGHHGPRSDGGVDIEMDVEKKPGR